MAKAQTSVTLKNGSTGSDVKKLQETLIAQGYDVGSTGADGIYGKNTAAAVKLYQKDNGLSVDGIAGVNTIGSLYGNNNASKNATTTTTTKTTTKNSKDTKSSTNKDTKKTETKETKQGQGQNGQLPQQTQQETAESSDFTYEPFTYQEFSYDPYEQSDIVKQAYAILDQHSASKPGAYQSQWEDEINDARDAYINRDPFSYDFNSDALYQQYKDAYIQQGRMAMMDTMGQAASMTGGYGNSYAQTVGQQAYNQQLNQLNDVIPELRQMAYDQYDREGTKLYNTYNMYLAADNKDYARWQDDVNTWYKELDYLTNRADTLAQDDYNQWMDGYNIARDDYNQGYDTAWNEYVMGYNTAYDEHNVERDREWAEQDRQQELELAEKEKLANKNMDAATLMAGVGDYDRLAAIYGLSDSEVAAIKDANAPKKTTGSGTGTGTYNKPSVTEINGFYTEFSRLTPEEAQRRASAYAYSGNYDPAFMAGIANDATGGYKDPDVVDTTVDVVGTSSADELMKQRQQQRQKQSKYMNTPTLY